MFPARDALECNEIGDTQLNVHYKDNKIQKLCTDEREMRKKRSDIEKKLRLRIKALEAADNLGDLIQEDPLGRWHKLNGTADNEPDVWAGDLSANWRLLVEPSDKDSLSAVTVTVTEICDYH